MKLPHSDIDPDGLLEYSVVFTDRSLNHMSARFVSVMEETLSILRSTYNAKTAVLVPGGGSYGMESVARQFAGGKRCLIVRNGQFSYRWSQILDTGQIPAEHEVLKARPAGGDVDAGFAPAPIEEVVETIRRQRTEIVFAPHVETASGVLLTDDYMRQIAEAVHEVGGLFVLDCVASGPLWVDMDDIGVDILLSAPQKGWSGTPCAGYIMFGERARTAIEDTTSSSFALDLKKWMTICEGYAEGKHGYHATMPTDSITHNLTLMQEAVEFGLPQLRERQIELGTKVRELLSSRGYSSVAAEGWQSPTVVVVQAERPAAEVVAAFAQAGVQVAGGVPLMVDEPEGFQTFRIGLFGLDKWADADAAAARLEAALDQVA